MVWGWNKDLESQGLRYVVFISLGNCVWKLDLSKVIAGEKKKKKKLKKVSIKQPNPWEPWRGILGCE